SLYLLCSAHLRSLHSFPTRRSSDLNGPHLAESDQVHSEQRNIVLLGKITPHRISALLRELIVVGILTNRVREPFDLENEVGLARSEEHTSELQSLRHLVCRLLPERR